jgi:flavin-dependent dehydrogenase
MMVVPAAVDVLVIGGGPAGASTALQAARLGHLVCLVDRGANVWHRGFAQSLAPSIRPLLDAVGVRDEVESRFPPCSGVCSLWGEDRPVYREFGRAGGFQIERAVFDQILLAAVLRAGAIVCSSATVTGVRRLPEPVTGWAVRIDMGARTADVHARVVVDASGKRSLTRKARARHSPPLMCVLGQWHDRETGSRSFIEAANDRWYWAAAQGNGSVTAAVFFDPRSDFLTNASVSAVYRRLIEQSRLLAGLSGGLLEQVTAFDATARHVHDPIEPDLLRVGESAVSIEPLSSQGIQTALNGGLQAGIVVNTWLRRPGQAGAADTFYRERHAETIRRSRENSSSLYAEAANRFRTPFWLERSGPREARRPPLAPTRPNSVVVPSARIKLAAGVHVEPTAVIRDNLAEFTSAVVAPGLERPVAFFGGIPVGELAGRLGSSASAGDTVQTWSGIVGETTALTALSWMWRTGVVEIDNN